MPTVSQVKRQIQEARGRQIGSDPIIETVRQRASQSLLPRAFPFGLAILSQEGRIADPAAFRPGWRGKAGPEKSPWQIHPEWHKFAKNTPVSNFAAYTDYAYNLLEQGFLKEGTLRGAARRFNSFNACEAGRTEACKNGRQYANEVMARLPKIEQALRDLGYQVGPDIVGPPGGGGGGGTTVGGFGATGGLILFGVLGGGVAIWAASQGEEIARRPKLKSSSSSSSSSSS